MKRIAFALVVSLIVCTGCSRDPNVRKQKYLESGNRYYEAGKYDEAIIQFSNALQVDPSFADAHYRLAQAYMKKNAWPAAYAELRRTIDIQPENLKAQLDLAGLLLVGHQVPDARLRVQSVLEKEPDNADAHALLGSINAAEGKPAEALTEMRRAVQLAPLRSDLYIQLGLLLASNQQGDEAEVQFKKAIELNPMAATPYLALGAWYAPRRPVEAEQFFRKAMEVAPKDTQARITLARFYLTQGKKAEAEQVITEAKNALPDDPVAFALLGDFYVGTGDLDKAVGEFANLYHERPKSVRIKKNYIELLLRKNRIDEAGKLTDEILKASNNKDYDALIFKAQIELSQNKPGDAIPRLDAALKAAPDSAYGHYLRGVAAAEQGEARTAETEWREAVRLRPTLLEAQQALAGLATRQGNTDLLAQVAEDLVKSLPNAPAGYVLRATAELNRRQAPQAEADLNKAIEIAPQSPTAYIKLGQMRLAQRRYVEAEKLLETALERDSNSIEALQTLAGDYLSQKQPAKALARVNAQITKAPQNGDFYILLGQLQIASKDFAGAENSLRKATELNPNNLTAYMLLGQIQVQQGSFDKAMASWEAWMRQNPKDVRAYFMLGALHDVTNNWQKAQELYHQALGITPDFAPAANNLAYSLLTHGGNPDMALSLAQVAKRGMPESPNANDTLAWAYYQKGIYVSASDLLRDAVQKQPNNATFHYHLGLTYDKLKRSPEAKAELQRALQLNPNGANASEIRKALETVGRNAGT